ncbi:MAG TPA: metal-dependent hydrolase, partial [Rubrobacter sp.]|nr:metal-dependent hydrolase [Rubrobacter sp.]
MTPASVNRRGRAHLLPSHPHLQRHPLPGAPAATAASLGAVLPDLPAIAGAAWLAARRLKGFSRREFETEVCGRRVFAGPDAALHSIPPVAMAALGACSLLSREKTRTVLLSFLLGWAGHVATDALTHGSDARPLLWPVSGYRFESPISYRERDRHA